MTLEIEVLTYRPSSPEHAFGLALVCRALLCRTCEVIDGEGLVLHVVGPKSVLVTLEPLLPRLDGRLAGSQSEVIGYAVAVAERLREHVLIPDGAEEAVVAEFRRRYEILHDQDAAQLDPYDYGDGRLAGQGFALFGDPVA